MTLVVIRQLLPADAPAYQALRLNALREHPQAFTSSFEEERGKPPIWAQQRLQLDPARPHDFFIGAFAPEGLRGMVGLQGRYRVKERHNATVVGMYVHPQHAGRGVGFSLMTELIGHAARLPGLEQLDLTVTVGQVGAQGLYARCGFVLIGVSRRAILVQGQYYDKAHMALQLR